MKFWLKIIAGLVLVMSLAQAGEQGPDALIRDTVQDVLTVIKQDKAIQNGDQRKIVALVEEKILPRFDFVRMTRLAVGKSWRAATPEQKQALVQEFHTLLVRTYAKVFAVYRDQVVEIKPFRMAEDATEATVKTSISKPGAQPVLVDYEMIRTSEGWKAFDVIIEGVSMVTSYRGTFASEIQQGGIDHLIKVLADKNAASANEPLRKAEGK
ncbi:MAG: ABC transporter substrate-binding protein [Gallionella sp.]|jgi:phospholipid transport system substrate-binding protein|nr:ABC transporter substrate-binding protein [Gallionella sp.]